VLLYAMDDSRKAKQRKARALLRRVAERTAPVISTQVLQEFYVASTTKLAVEPLVAKSLLRSFENMETVQVDPGMIREAVDISILNRLSFWDSLILATAESAHCGILYTADLSSGQIIRGVQIENPF
jgi:predicted nucleic acid-binding protein